jgi:hypothetical protein
MKYVLSFVFANKEEESKNILKKSEVQGLQFKALN